MQAKLTSFDEQFRCSPRNQSSNFLMSSDAPLEPNHENDLGLHSCRKLLYPRCHKTNYSNEKIIQKKILSSLVKSYWSSTIFFTDGFIPKIKNNWTHAMRVVSGALMSDDTTYYLFSIFEKVPWSYFISYFFKDQEERTREVKNFGDSS